MSKLACTLLVFVTAIAPVRAQSQLRSKLRPITSPVKNAGVLNLATGQWTRGSSGQAFVAGPEIVYANTCFTGYYGGQIQGEEWTDEGAIPNPAMPQTASVSIPGAFDTDSGCSVAYNINGFQIGYCSYQLTFGCAIDFYDNYQQPMTFCAVPGTPTISFVLTGLPASTAVSVQACWLVGIDLSGGASNFTLDGTDDPTGAGLPQFGWSFSITGLSDPATPDGPIIAGGVNTSGSPLTCSGTDATRWDQGTASINWPANRSPGPVFPLANEEGSGMLSQDAFRLDPVFAPSGPACYYFGGNPTASFHLELYSDVPCTPETGTGFGFPNEGGVIACPCGNDPLPGSMRGCNNSANTGGARLTATGDASIANDTLQFLATDLKPFATSQLFQGDAQIPSGVLFGDGVRCEGGNLKRLNIGSADATGFVAFPNATSPQLVHVLGGATAGLTLYYTVFYRDSDTTFCVVGATFNKSPGRIISWTP